MTENNVQYTHHYCATKIMEKYKNQLKCISIKDNDWYQFSNHRWRKINTDALRKLIVKELTELVTDRYLTNAMFVNGVMRECTDITYDSKFLEKLDENIYLICFENGVYDLQSNVFRDGRYSDYISLCTGYNYIPYDKNDEMSKGVKDFFKKIQPDKEMRKYLKMLLAACLSRSDNEENYYIFTGSGANGKSKLMELMKYTLGDLYKSSEPILTIDDLADKKGIRINSSIHVYESEISDEINTGFMKIIAGGDTIMANSLYSEPIYFKPQFTQFYLCNHLPNIKSNDGGTWRRLKVIPFLSKFVELSETNEITREGLPENHFCVDNNLSEKIPQWKEMFMGMLLKSYEKYCKEGLVHPELVIKHTAEYRKRCDVYQDFI